MINYVLSKNSRTNNKDSDVVFKVQFFLKHFFNNVLCFCFVQDDYGELQNLVSAQKTRIQSQHAEIIHVIYIYLIQSQHRDYSCTIHLLNSVPACRDYSCNIHLFNSAPACRDYSCNIYLLNSVPVCRDYSCNIYLHNSVPACRDYS